MRNRQLSAVVINCGDGPDKLPQRRITNRVAYQFIGQNTSRINANGRVSISSHCFVAPSCRSPIPASYADGPNTHCDIHIVRRSSTSRRLPIHTPGRVMWDVHSRVFRAGW